MSWCTICGEDSMIMVLWNIIILWLFQTKETGFLRDLCLFANFPEGEQYCSIWWEHAFVINHCYSLNLETGSRPNLQESLRGLKFTKQQEDFELKKGLLCLLCSLSSDHVAAKVMSEEKVIRSLLSFVTRNDKVEADLWNPAQFEELQLLVSALL